MPNPRIPTPPRLPGQGKVTMGEIAQTNAINRAFRDVQNKLAKQANNSGIKQGAAAPVIQPSFPTTSSVPLASSTVSGSVKTDQSVADPTVYLSTTVDTLLAAKENSLSNPSTNGYVLASTTSGARSWVPKSLTKFGQAVTGVINGSNKTFTLPDTPITLALYLLPLTTTLGIGIAERVSSGYTFTGNTITFTTAPVKGAGFIADYTC